jgi:tRNA(Ile)-lysidine synthase
MSLSPQSIAPVLQPYLAAPRWWVGLSGGLDSVTLLQLLVDLRETVEVPPLVAVHVDHQLSTHAQDWGEHCQALCARLDVELVRREVSVVGDGSGPEAAARTARYSVFEELVGAGELLLLAHHSDDQIETFFLRLMRGAGTLGLSGMPQQRVLGRGRLLRPLLEFPRAALQSYARNRQLSWVEDDSNQDQALDRNYLRLGILPGLAQRWPAYRNNVEQAMQAVAAAETELSDLYRPFVNGAVCEYFGEPCLDLSTLQDLAPAALARVLRLWLVDLQQVPPGRARLMEFIRQLQSGDESAGPELAMAAYALRRYRDRLHYVADLPPLPTALECSLTITNPLQVTGLGDVQMTLVDSGGLALPAKGSWRLALRAGGERCQPVGRAHSQSLKKLLQEYGVPPWWRDRLPLLYDGDELVAVADLWVCEGHGADAGTPGYEFHWR